MQAEWFLATDIIDGRMDLAQSMTAESYWRLEGKDGRRWFRYVKELKAYLRWRSRGGGWGEEPKTEDYLQACLQVQRAVLAPDRKAPQSAFEPIQRYIDKRFLTPDGKLDPNKDPVKEWIRAKAEVCGLPWQQAEGAAKRYMKGFYENIGPAVLRGDEQSVRSVVEALGLREDCLHSEPMVNCFEMAIAIYFVDGQLARKVLHA